MSTQQVHNYRRSTTTGDRVIAHVIDTLAPGGTERTLVALLRAFDPTQFRHVVVTLRGAGRLASELPDHAACRPLCVEGRSRCAGVRLAATVRELGVELIHARNTGCWFDAGVARILNPRVRLVLGYHGSQTDESFGNRLRRRVRLGLMAGGHFTSVSGAGGRRLRDRVGVPARRIDVLQNGVELGRFANTSEAARREAREAMRIKPGDFVVGSVGSLTPVKRQVCLLEALAATAKHLPSARVLLVGEGPLRVALIERARELGIERRVVLAGQQTDIPAMLRCMDVYVCCSAVEGISNALLEAMASGLPVVTTDVGDHALIVRDGVEGRIIQHAGFASVAPGFIPGDGDATHKGWRYSPVGATAALGSVLVDLARDAELRTRWGKAARRRATAFSFERTVRTYEAFYDRMLWRRPSP